MDTGKRVWNQLRLKTNTPEQTQALVAELIPLVTGRAHALALRHDASRVVQAALQFGSNEQRRAIVQELCCCNSTNNKNIDNKTNNSGSTGGWMELCQSQYAHFVVLKVLTYCHGDPECWRILVQSFRGTMPKLAIHATGSKVIEALFLLLSSQQQPSATTTTTKTSKKTAANNKNTLQLDETAIRETWQLFQELYGPHVVLFADGVDTGVVAAATSESNAPPQQSKRRALSFHLDRLADKRDVILDFVRNLVHKGMGKQLYGFTYFQEYLLEFCQVVTPVEIRSLAATGADSAIHLLSAKAGTRVVALWIAYGTAKERKRILRSCKGYTRSGLLHRQAYLAILRLVQCTDDTVSIHKNLFNELCIRPTTTEPNESDSNESPLLEIALSDTGSKLFLILLIDELTHSDSYKKVLDPYEHSVLFPNPVIVENGQEAPTSRKDASVRRQELLQYLREPLIEMCCQHTATLLRSIPGSTVLKEVYKNLNRPPAVIDAVLGVCEAVLLGKKDNMTEEPDNAKESWLFEDVTGHRALKNLILVDADEKSDDNNDGSTTTLSEQFSDRFSADQFMTIAGSNRGAFVIEALCKSVTGGSKAPALLGKLSVKKLQANKANGKGPTAGWDSLLKRIPLLK